VGRALSFIGDGRPERRMREHGVLQHLILRATAGDDEALSDLVAEVEPFLHRGAGIRMRNRADFERLRMKVGASDICQSVLRELTDLRKTCATYCDEHVPESSVEILGHSVGGINVPPLCPPRPLLWDGRGRLTRRTTAGGGCPTFGAGQGREERDA